MTSPLLNSAMMKKISFSLSLLLLSPFIFSQDAEVWPQPNAVWQYCVSEDFPEFQTWTHTFAYTTDTMIGGHAYAMVQHTEVNGEALSPDGSSWVVPEEAMRTYFRQAGDTIYRHVNGQDYVFMVQGIDISAEFTTFRSTYMDWELWNCAPELPLEVLSVQELDYAGATYRELNLKDLDPYFNQEFSFDNTYEFIEGIGLKNGFIYLTPEHSGIGDIFDSGDLSQCMGGAFHLPASSLYHYHDDNVNIDFFQCDFSVSTTNVSQERNITVYPNPSQGQFTIHIDGAGQGLLDIQVFDLSGKVMLQQNQVSANQKIDISSISPGLYLLHVRDERQSYIEKLVVQ